MQRGSHSEVRLRSGSTRTDSLHLDQRTPNLRQPDLLPGQSNATGTRTPVEENFHPPRRPYDTTGPQLVGGVVVVGRVVVVVGA